ncbi:sigma-70 family RNA polymerase sigma factor [Sedimentibacter sp. zth1]|uniref:sigma-70 family RNA polymerase sigma factor n=1 Tax=Sedimentibacter sp. zth1 TaxID=2816908 RepID=UPI001A937AFD|nr:sigma-70 family RNA polymerase sigma factor [Sedimentibacter sp. zth1]QSX05969.1 sigma-70 family RNA polymerase sigma factor [Sedimentibacter sp. zth1]
MVDNTVSNINKNTLYDELDDEELITLIKKGDIFAEECLYGRYIRTIRKIISPFFLIGADKDDLLQEGMLGLYKAINEYKTNKQCSFKSYASLCIKRHIITIIRSSTRQKHNPLNNYVSFNMLLCDSNGIYILDTIANNYCDNPESIIILNENKRKLNFIINKNLSNFEKKVISCYISGLSYHEASIILETDEKSIDNALQRIKKKMREQLDVCEV